jgi:VanZ family protein
VRGSRPQARRLVLGVFACLLIWVGGNLVHAQVAEVLVSPWDKLVHLTLYTGVALGAGLLLGVRRPRDLWRCFLLALLVGVMDEGLQFFEPGRSVDADDLLANAVGALLGTALHALHWRWRAGPRADSEDSALTRH